MYGRIVFRLGTFGLLLLAIYIQYNKTRLLKSVDTVKGVIDKQGKA